MPNLDLTDATRTRKQKFWEKQWYKQYEVAAKIWTPISFMGGLLSKIMSPVIHKVTASQDFLLATVMAAYYAIATTGLLLFSFVIADWTWKNLHPDGSRKAFWIWMGMPIFVSMLVLIFETERMYLMPAFFFGLGCLILFVVVT